jgi:hypothetical protein
MSAAACAACCPAARARVQLCGEVRGVVEVVVGWGERGCDG